jgi:hypothetical protein
MTKEGDFKKKFDEELLARLAKYDVEIDIFQNKSGRRSTLDTIYLGPCSWAMLEFKRSADAAKQPNQDYFVEDMNQKGYAAFVYPENAEEKLNDLERLFTVARNTCVPFGQQVPLVKLHRGEAGKYVPEFPESSAGDEVS